VLTVLLSCASLVVDVLLRCLESLERKASEASDQQETSAALKEVKQLRNVNS